MGFRSDPDQFFHATDPKQEIKAHLDSGLDVDGGDLLDNLGGGVEIDHTLVDPHLELVPGLGSLSARSLTGGDTQSLGGQNLNINRDMN